MPRSRISLITPSYNQANFIERTIQSVLRQQGEFDLDYVVVDGGSTDGTLEILRKQRGLQWISEPDQGQVDAINKGLRRARGDIVGWLNSDDLLLPGALGQVADAFRNHPRLEWLHGRCEIVDANDRPIRRWVSAYKDWRSRRYSYRRLLTENFVSQMTVFWRQSLLEQVGYLNPQLKLAFDYDLWLRFGKRSDPLYIPERLGCFRWYEVSKSGSNFRRQFAEDYAVARTHAPPGQPWLHLCKRLKTAQTLTAYQVLSLGRALVRWGARRAPGSKG